VRTHAITGNALTGAVGSLSKSSAGIDGNQSTGAVDSVVNNLLVSVSGNSSTGGVGSRCIGCRLVCAVLECPVRHIDKPPTAR